MTRYEDAVPSRTISPHDADAIVRTAAATSLIRDPHTAFVIC